MKPGQPFYWEDSNKGASGPPKRSLKILIILLIVVFGLLVSRLPFLRKNKESVPPTQPVAVEQSGKAPRLFVGAPSCRSNWLKDSSSVLLRCGRPRACADCLPASVGRELFLHIVDRAVDRIGSPDSLEASLKRATAPSSGWRLSSLNFRESGLPIRFSGTPIPLSRSSLWAGGFRFCSDGYGCLGDVSEEDGGEELEATETTGEIPGSDSLLSTSYWPMPHLSITAEDSLSLTVPFPGTVSEIRLNHSGGKRIQVFHRGGLFSYYEGRFHVKEDLALGAYLDESRSVGLVEAGQKVRFFMEDMGLYVDPIHFKTCLTAAIYER